MSQPVKLIAAALLAWAALACAAPPGPFPRDGMDVHVRPQDDLWLAANGGWLRDTAIPPDRADWGVEPQLNELVDRRLRAIAQQRPSVDRRVVLVTRFYRAYIDEAAIERAGLAPVAGSLAEIDGLADRTAVAAWLGRWHGVVDGPLRLEVVPDPDAPDRLVVSCRPSGLGLPDRADYLSADERGIALRAAYEAYLARLLALSGDTQAPAHAARVLALESRLAAIDRGHDEASDLPTHVADLAARAPAIAWPDFLTAAGLPADAKVIVAQPGDLAALSTLIEQQPLSTWQLYLRTRRLDAVAPVLPRAFRQARFEFRGARLRGQQAPLPRWQAAVHALDGALGDELGALYVARHFPPPVRARAQALANALLAQARASAADKTWMTPETRAAASAKLSRLVLRVGHPDHWRDPGGLDIRADDALGNLDRAGRFAWRRAAQRVGQPVSDDDWAMTPQTVNARYDATRNRILLPAALLQPPYFDPEADAAANFGALGAIVGHEISHAMDLGGSRFDADGRQHDWWTDADHAAWDERAARLAAQFGAYEPLPGHAVDGARTQVENAADLAGLHLAFDAWQQSLRGRPAPVIAGLTGEQRFFLAWARVWRTRLRDERALQLLQIDVHAPARLRADGAAMNLDAFHDAFATRPGDAMWKAPEQRIRPW